MANLKDDLKSKKTIFGLKRTLKEINRNKIKRVYVAMNSPAKEQLVSLGKTMGIEVVVLNENNKDLGVTCKKPFAVSVIGFE